MEVRQHTPGRCGSTLISQIVIELVGRENYKGLHSRLGEAPDKRVILAVRDFRDIMVSAWRVKNDTPLAELDDLKMTEAEVGAEAWETCGKISHIDFSHNNNPHALILRYEEFFGNFSFLLDEISKYLKIHIPKKQRRKMEANYGFKSNLKKSLKMNSFLQHDSGFIHGLHIYQGKIGGWKDFVKEKHRHIVNNILREGLEKWGYKV